MIGNTDGQDKYSYDMHRVREVLNDAAAFTNDLLGEIKSANKYAGQSRLFVDINKSVVTFSKLQHTFLEHLPSAVNAVFKDDEKEFPDFADTVLMPEFHIKKAEMNGFADPIFVFTMPFAGRRRGKYKEIYGSDLGISPTHYFDIGIKKATAMMEKNGCLAVRFDRYFLLFEHYYSIKNFPSGLYDLDNIDTKKIIDSLNPVFTFGDESDKIWTFYRSFPHDCSFTRMFLTSQNQAVSFLSNYDNSKGEEGSFSRVLLAGTELTQK